MELITELTKAIEEKNTIVGYINNIQSEINSNPFDEKLLSHMRQLKEKVNRINKKIQILKQKDKNRE